MGGWDFKAPPEAQPQTAVQGQPSDTIVTDAPDERHVPFLPDPGQQIKIVMLLPHRDEKRYGIWDDRLWMMEKPKDTMNLQCRGMDVATSRNHLVQMVLNNKDMDTYTHLFWLDDDVMPPMDVLPRLVKASIPIACGLYMAKKQANQRGLAAWCAAPGKGPGVYIPIDRKQSGRYVEVDVTGMGCALITRKVFEKLKPPWFVWDPPPAVSEDFYFFERCSKELGLKPIIDMECACEHLGAFSLSIDNVANTVGV